MKVVIVALVVAVFCSQGAAAARIGREALAATVTGSVQGENQVEARRIWEQAVAAKGGRERLYAVRSMLVSGELGYTTRRRRSNQAHREYLLVFPNKYWFYEDYGSDVFGVQVHMFNYEAKTQYIGQPGDAGMRLEPLKSSGRNQMMDDQTLSFLLETRWLKPTPLRASRGKIGPKSVDVVETETPGGRVDFAFDADTHLTIRVSFYSTYNDKIYITAQSFSGYTEVSGIKVPQVTEYEDGTKDRTTIEFNVEYDESLFATPPHTRVGPDMWRPKKED